MEKNRSGTHTRGPHLSTSLPGNYFCFACPDVRERPRYTPEESTKNVQNENRSSPTRPSSVLALTEYISARQESRRPHLWRSHSETRLPIVSFGISVRLSLISDRVLHMTSPAYQFVRPFYPEKPDYRSISSWFISDLILSDIPSSFRFPYPWFPLVALTSSPENTVVIVGFFSSSTFRLESHIFHQQ